jgi:site-specific recombinase
VGIKKSAQELKRDLNNVACNLEQTAGEISRLAERINDVDVVAVLHLMNRLYKDSDRLKAYVDEIKSGRIVRNKAD